MSNKVPVLWRLGFKPKFSVTEVSQTIKVWLKLLSCCDRSNYLNGAIEAITLFVPYVGTTLISLAENVDLWLRPFDSR